MTKELRENIQLLSWRQNSTPNRNKPMKSYFSKRKDAYLSQKSRYFITMLPRGHPTSAYVTVQSSSRITVRGPSQIVPEHVLLFS